MTPSNEDLEREFERLLRDPLTRRHILKRGAAGVMSASALAYLAACGTDEPSGGNGDKAEEEKPIAKGKIASDLYFANWPAYIDEKREALKSFEDKYGTKVKYVEEINDNTEFFGKVRQQYDQGQSGGRDIHVVTDWMAARMIRLGYVQKFDKSSMPNANANLIERLKSPPFDPNRDLSDSEQRRLIAGGAYWFVWPRARIGAVLTNERVRYDVETRADENRLLAQMQVEF